jgi:mycofactocin system glycosyltransferase
MSVPLPPTFGISPLPGTSVAGTRLSGGRPVRRIDLSPTAAPVVGALLAGETVALAAEAGGCTTKVAGMVARRLVATGMAGPRPEPMVGGDVASVAAIIPAHDAERTIATALSGLVGVAEVIVVDDGSSDGTGDVAAAAGARVLRNERPTGPSAARNRGIAASTADLVVVLDSDAEPSAGWLAPLLAHLADPTVGGVGPRVVALDDGSALGAYEATSGSLDLGGWPAVVRPDGPVPFVSTTALLLRRSLWEELGGFAEDLRFGEDLDFAWRAAAAGRPLVYEPAALVAHRHRSALADHLRNRNRYGSAAGPLGRRHGHHPRPAVAPPLLTAAAAAAVTGFPRAAAALTATSVAITAAKLHEEGDPPADAVREALRATMRAGRGLAAAVSRPWLPAALALASIRSRSRPVVAGAVLARLARNRPPPKGSAAARSWPVLRFLDDLWFSTGVLQGCVAARTIRPLVPAGSPGPHRTTTVLGTELVLP